MWVRVYRHKEDKEILFNTDHIWKIEVSYGVPDKNILYSTSLSYALNHPDAIRVYKVFINTEVVGLPAVPDDPIVQIIEKIYKDAIKGGGKKETGET
jgi:hypothetical protein